jgi:RNA polymerase sigma-70 factor (ECF subfamily)
LLFNVFADTPISPKPYLSSQIPVYYMNMLPSEAELLQCARQANEQALGEIYDAYSSRLYGYAYRLSGDDAFAKDVVSETFYRFLVALRDGGGPREHLLAYLYRVAYHLVVDNARRQPYANLFLDESFIATDANPSERGDERETQAREALWELTSEQRQVIVLKYFEGFSNEDVAIAMGKPIGSIKSLQSRALAALRRVMSQVSEGVPND